MRFKALMAVAVAAGFLGILAAPQSATAFGWDRPDQARHWVYHPHRRHVVMAHEFADPYEYRYIPRGYYPYYNSQYWGRPRIKRFRAQLPPYYAAWGAPRRGYRHVEWHRRHYGGHRRGDW